MQFEPDDTASYERHFEDNGFVVIRNVLDQSAVEETVSEIYDFLGFSHDNLPAHYDERLRAPSGIDERGIIPFYHGQKLWDNRQSEAIYRIFSRLLGDSNLIVSVDRCNVNPPQRPNWNYTGFTHFDVDTTVVPVPIELQGILGLSRAEPNGGGFRCHPGFHRRIDDWVKTREPGDPRTPRPGEFDLIDVPLGPGDFLVFDGRLPHGNSANKSDVVRVAQYITMWRAGEELFDPEDRRKCIEQKSAPLSRKGRRFPSSPKGEDASSPVQLTGLGRRLNGLPA